VTRAAEPTLTELRARYTVNVAEMARLLGVTRETVYRRLVGADGHRTTKKSCDPVFLDWLGRRVPARRNANGDLMFLVAEADRAFTDDSP